MADNIKLGDPADLRELKAQKEKHVRLLNADIADIDQRLEKLEGKQQNQTKQSGSKKKG